MLGIDQKYTLDEFLQFLQTFLPKMGVNALNLSLFDHHINANSINYGIQNQH
jgi:hypothetical protein